MIFIFSMVVSFVRNASYYPTPSFSHLHLLMILIFIDNVINALKISMSAHRSK